MTVSPLATLKTWPPKRGHTTRPQPPNGGARRRAAERDTRPAHRAHGLLSAGLAAKRRLAARPVRHASRRPLADRLDAIHSHHPTVAWAEYCRNHPRDVDAADVTGGVGLDDAALAALGPLELGVPARALYELDFAFDCLADLTSDWAIELLGRAGFDTNSLTADPPGYGDCPELASIVADLAWQAILVPSAAWRWPDGLCVPVFEAGASALATHRMTLAAAQPSVAIAAATSYVAGARPRWLG